MQDVPMSPPSRSECAREAQLLALNAQFAAAAAGEKGRELAALARQTQVAGQDCAALDALLQAGGEAKSSRVELWQLELQQRLQMLANAVARWTSTVSSGARVR